MRPRFLDGPTGEHLQALLTSAREAETGDVQAWRLLTLSRAITTALAESQPGSSLSGTSISAQTPMERIWADLRARERL